MILYLPFALVSGFFGTRVAKVKGRDTVEGFLLGFFLNFLGILVEAVLPSKK